jgi:two-component system, sensor histidine kinase and response regulator
MADDGGEPLDRPILDGLRAYGGPRILVSTIDSFLQHAPQRLQSLADALGRGDLEQTTWAAHSLRGSCGTVGALGLAQACARLETEAAAGSVAGAVAVFAEVQRRWPAVLDALEAERRRARAAAGPPA